MFNDMLKKITLTLVLGAVAFFVPVSDLSAARGPRRSATPRGPVKPAPETEDIFAGEEAYADEQEDLKAMADDEEEVVERGFVGRQVQKGKDWYSSLSPSARNFLKVLGVGAAGAATIGGALAAKKGYDWRYGTSADAGPVMTEEQEEAKEYIENVAEEIRENLGMVRFAAIESLFQSKSPSEIMGLKRGDVKEELMKAVTGRVAEQEEREEQRKKLLLEKEKKFERLVPVRGRRSTKAMRELSAARRKAAREAREAREEEKPRIEDVAEEMEREAREAREAREEKFSEVLVDLPKSKLTNKEAFNLLISSGKTATEIAKMSRGELRAELEILEEKKKQQVGVEVQVGAKEHAAGIEAALEEGWD